jgi:hypothetical protein
MRDELRLLRPDRKIEIELIPGGSEDFQPALQSIDFSVWSPPYLDETGVIIEEYSDEASQSHIRFSDRTAWLADYFRATLRNIFRGFKAGATLVLNVNEEMVPDATALAIAEGFSFQREMRYAMSRIKGSKHLGDGLTSEPLLVFMRKQ